MAGQRKARNSRRWVATVKMDSTHPAPGLFKKRCIDDRQSAGVEEGFAERPAVWNAHAELFHKSRGARIVGVAAAGVGKGQEVVVKEDGRAGAEKVRDRLGDD
jgi:hypothetical protein